MMAVYSASEMFPDDSTGFGVYSNAGASQSLSAGVWTQLSNDGAGADTDTSGLPEGSAKLWDTVGDYLYLQDVPYNSLITLQIKLSVTTTVANEVLSVQLHAYNAGASVVTFLLQDVDLPVAGTHEVIVTRRGFINGIIRALDPVVDYDVEVQAKTSAASTLTIDSIFITKDD